MELEKNETGGQALGGTIYFLGKVFFIVGLILMNLHMDKYN